MPVQDRDLQALLHATGRRLTGQRRALLEIIRAQGAHLDAQELYLLAREQHPRLNISTVYRTLGLLRDLGLVDEVHLGQDHHHYEIKPAATHHHLICLRCGQIEEFSSRLAEDLVSAVAREHRFAIAAAQIDLTGYCSRCRQEMAAARRPERSGE